MRWGIAVTLALSVPLSLPTLATTIATVQTIEGTLSLNRGEGYVEVTTWADAQAGSRVMANRGSWGKIIYSDGCDVTVKPGSVYTIQDASPCLSGGIGGSARTYVLGGVAIAAGVVGIVVLTNGGGDNNGGKKKASDDDDEPASP